MQHITISCAPLVYKFVFLCHTVLLLAATELIMGGIPDASFYPEPEHRRFTLVYKQFYFLAFICLHEI